MKYKYRFYVFAGVLIYGEVDIYRFRVEEADGSRVGTMVLFVFGMFYFLCKKGIEVNLVKLLFVNCGWWMRVTMI